MRPRVHTALHHAIELFCQARRNFFTGAAVAVLRQNGPSLIHVYPTHHDVLTAFPFTVTGHAQRTVRAALEVAQVSTLHLSVALSLA